MLDQFSWPHHLHEVSHGITYHFFIIRLRESIHNDKGSFFFCQGSLDLWNDSRYLYAYSLKLSISFFSMVINAMRLGAVSTTWLYWAKNAFTKLIHVCIWLRSNLMYHLAADPVRLYWKQWIRNLSFPVWSTIFWKNIIILALGQVDLLYLTKSCILNF